MHLKYQVIGKNFVDAICHSDERHLNICMQILLLISEGWCLSLVELYSGCVYVRVCAFYLYPHFTLFFSSLVGSMIERILVSCNNQQDLHEWVDHLQKQTKVTSVSNPPIKPHSVPSHTVRTPIFLLCPNSRVSFWLSCQQVSNNLKCYQIWIQNVQYLSFSANICFSPLNSEYPHSDHSCETALNCASSHAVQWHSGGRVLLCSEEALKTNNCSLDAFSERFNCTCYISSKSKTKKWVFMKMKRTRFMLKALKYNFWFILI